MLEEVNDDIVIIEEVYDNNEWKETSSSTSSMTNLDMVNIEFDLNEEEYSVDEGEMRLLKVVILILVVGIVICRN